VTKPNPENCKNCSSKCAHDCAQLQYTIQNRTVLIISPLTSRHHSSDVVYQRRGGVGTQGSADLRFHRPQPDTSLCCKTMDTVLMHYLFVSKLYQVILFGDRGTWVWTICSGWGSNLWPL